ncbi:MAG: dethiobiotin synthase [Actinomycetota bacterium]|nr:dethiobiotin synthase [Actinomycetota bacterium]
MTGTGTGVGKTVLAGAILAALRARGMRVRALKPVVTGLNEPPDPDWPPDHELLAAAASSPPEQVTAIGYGPPVSPHLAGELAGRPIVPAQLLEAARRAAADCEALIVEGVGGLLVPLAGAYDVRAFAADLGLPLVIAARPGLGTINHTLLTLEAARAAGLRVAAVVLTPWPADPGEIERSNRETIARLGQVSVATLAPIARGTPELLAGAGAALPLDEWFSAFTAA